VGHVGWGRIGGEGEWGDVAGRGTVGVGKWGGGVGGAVEGEGKGMRRGWEGWEGWRGRDGKGDREGAWWRGGGVRPGVGGQILRRPPFWRPVKRDMCITLTRLILKKKERY